MAERKYTIETRIDFKYIEDPQKRKEAENGFKRYYEAYIKEYNQAKRELFYILRDPSWIKKYKTESYLRSWFREKHNFEKRTVNSIINEVKGMINALTELKKTELSQLDIKIDRKNLKIKELKNEINRLKPDVTKGKISDKKLRKYQRDKKKLYYCQNSLNKMKQHRDKLDHEIRNRILKIGFGEKKNFKRQYNLEQNGFHSHKDWYNYFVKERDKNIFYLGASDETCGNQMFQLREAEDGKAFRVKIRKENRYSTERRNDPANYIILERITFGHMQDKLMEIVKTYGGRSKKGEPPLSFRIRREKKKWYLQCCFEFRHDGAETFSKYGVIGLDYNNGFIEASETDEAGNLIRQVHYNLEYHGTGKKAENEIRQVAHQIAVEAARKGKDVVIEDLNFIKKKAKTEKAKGKKGKTYNRMIHLFDYKRYTESLKNSCHKNRVLLKVVSAYNTSRIGVKKYAYAKKLNAHQAASYVIARRGQGFHDCLKE